MKKVIFSLLTAVSVSFASDVELLKQTKQYFRPLPDVFPSDKIL